MTRWSFPTVLWCGSLVAFGNGLGGAAETSGEFLTTMPAGYSLQAYDDCGVENRQPHVVMKDAFFFTFALSDTDAGIKERSAVFSLKPLQAVYTNRLARGGNKDRAVAIDKRCRVIFPVGLVVALGLAVLRAFTLGT